MSTIGGYYGFGHSDEERSELLFNINEAQKSRGFKKPSVCCLGSLGLAAGNGLLSRCINGRTCAVALDGEFYNRRELWDLLKARGEAFEEAGDEALALSLYLHYGPEFVQKLNGVFALAVADSCEKRLFLFRDRIGAKPLFWARRNGQTFFSSLLKGLFSCPGVEPKIDRDGLNEIFSIGPARTPGNAVFKGIRELKPGCRLTVSPDGVREEAYWTLHSRPHEDSYETTVNTVTELVLDAITRQAAADPPVCTLLSGGLDSSLVSAVCAGLLSQQGKKLETFSFDFKDNDRYFKANDFQPSMDRPYVDAMVRWLNSDHHYLECSSETQVDLLSDSVMAADLPVMADIDSSLLYFCSRVAKYSSITLTGECADEIFGGYPWFHKPEMLNAKTFPWTRDLEARKVLLSEDFLRELHMETYVNARYEESLADVPRCPEDSIKEARRREISWLNLKWFMQTLLNRMDRTSSAAGLTARVPLADHRIVEYLWNIPWDMKAKDGVVKHLLRESGRGLLPDEVLFRRKSPYPKTYVPGYEKLLAENLLEILNDASSPILPFLDRKKVLRFLESPSDYGRPWYGQLMAAPQMMAYMIQVNFWLRHYRIHIIP